MDKKHIGKYESSISAEKNDFIGKKRYESNNDHSYSKERGFNHIRHDYERNKYSNQGNYSSNFSYENYQGSSYQSQKDDNIHHDQKYTNTSNSNYYQGKYYNSNTKYNKYYPSSQQNSKAYNSTGNHSSTSPNNSAFNSYSNYTKKDNFEEKNKNNNLNYQINNSSNKLYQNSSSFDPKQTNSQNLRSPEKSSNYSQNQNRPLNSSQQKNSFSSSGNQAINISNNNQGINNNSNNYYNNSTKLNINGNQPIQTFNSNINNNYSNYQNNNNLNRQFSNNSINQSFYQKNHFNNINNNNINLNSNTNSNQNWYSQSLSQTNNPNQNSVKDIHYNNCNESFDNSNDENEWNNINSKFKFFSDTAELTSDFLKQTFDEKYYYKLQTEFNIKENLLKDLELLKPEDIENINEKKLLAKFIEEKIQNSLIQTDSNKENSTAMKNDDFLIEIPLADKNNKIQNEQNEYMQMNSQSQEGIDKLLFHKEIDFEEFGKFFSEETNLEYKKYLDTLSFEPFLKTENKTKIINLEPSFILSHLANNTKNKKLEKFIKESISSEMLEKEKNKFIDIIKECEKSEFENDNKEKNNTMTDEEASTLIKQNEITEEMIKFTYVDLPYFHVQEEFPKEIRDLENNAKKIKSDIYSYENNLTKIFNERLEIKKRLNKLHIRIENSKEIKQTYEKYKNQNQQNIDYNDLNKDNKDINIIF